MSAAQDFAKLSLQGNPFGEPEMSHWLSNPAVMLSPCAHHGPEFRPFWEAMGFSYDLDCWE
jgi:hypothetical protein